MVNGPFWANRLSNRLGYTVTRASPTAHPGAAAPPIASFRAALSRNAHGASPVKPTMQFIPLPNTGDNLFYYRLCAQDQGRQGRPERRFHQQLTGNWSVYYFYDDSTVNDPFPAANVPGFPTADADARPTGRVEQHQGFRSDGGERVARRASCARPPRPTSRRAASPISPISDFMTGANTLGIVSSGPRDSRRVPPLLLQ